MRFVVVVLGLLAGAAHAGVPDVITYAGSLKQGGAPASGTFSTVFTLFDDATAGTARFTQSESSLVVIDGVLVVDLGGDAGNTLDDAVLEQGTLFLEVAVNGETLAPRVPLTSVPYARVAKKAEDANTVAGLDATGIAGLHTADPNGGLVDNAGAFGIADDGVTSARILDGTIDTGDVADHAITFAKLDLTGHSTAIFGVPTGVDFCPNLTPGGLTPLSVCQSAPVSGTVCQSLQPLPAGCNCTIVGGSSSEAVCAMTFFGLVLR